MKTQSSHLFQAALAATLITLGPAGVQAEDIDLFCPGKSSKPNVLIVLDNSANWSAANQGWPTDPSPPVACGNDCGKQGYYELKAIRTVVNGLPDNVEMSLGLMLFNNTNATRDGAYVRYHVQPLNKAAFVAKLDNIITNFNTETAASSVQYAAALFDAFKYFGGFTNPDSNTEAPPDPSPTYSGIPVFGTAFWGSNNADGSKPDPAAYAGADYKPIDPSVCGRNFILFVGNGFPAKDNTTPDMYEVLRELTYPLGWAATTINEFPLTTVTPVYSAWTNATGFVCAKDEAKCAAQLPSDTATTIYRCDTSNCSGDDQRVQSATLISSTTTTAPPSGNATDRYADEFAYFLRKTDVSAPVPCLVEDKPCPGEGQQFVTTYAVDVYRNKPDADQTALMRNVAKYGGGKYFAATNQAALIKAFSDAFSEMLSVNAAYSSASLPVNVNTQGTYLNRVFIGMFRPDASRLPRWAGNLKQYKFKLENDSLFLVDKDNRSAVSATTGFITPCAVSHWTTADPSPGYWALDPSGTCSQAGSSSNNAPDGEVVDKGAAAQRLRGLTPTARKVLTCADADCTGALVPFNTTQGPSAAALGVAIAERDTLINWVRGMNTDGEKAKPTPSTTEMRPSVHGDIVHSRPLAIDFGTAATPDIKVFYGSNDGTLRGIDADQLDSEGTEMWSFVAPERWARLKRLKSNAPLINACGFDTGERKDYFFDGSVSGWQKGSSVWIYTGMRRGGRRVYAFDVSTPASPVLKWRKGCPNLGDDSGCDTGFASIGQTWSTADTILTAGYTGGSPAAPKPIVLFGGGYDGCEDAEPNGCTASKGNQIFVLDADSGALLKALTHPDMTRSVAADITAVDSDDDGLADLAYAVDTGGNLYRINMGTVAPADWTLTLVAALGCADGPCEPETLNRKFLHAPEVVVTKAFNVVLVGSGDREHPKPSDQAKTVDNAFFMIKDKPPVAGWLTDACGTKDFICLTSLQKIDPEGTGPTAADVQADTFKGWYLAFGTDADGVIHDGEQVVTSAVVVAGIAYFSTHTPTPPKPNQCNQLGTARGYAVNFLTGKSSDGTGVRFGEFVGGGLAPSPVGGIVQMEDGKLVAFVIGGRQQGGGVASPLEGQNAGKPIAGARSRTYWYVEPPQ